MSDPVRDDEDGAFRDDFLFHLSRGAELLRDARVHESKEELERALRVRPRDPHGQDMLAQVYYRLGVYPRAVELFQDLLAQHPGSAALHVNLALVYLKTGQPQEAQGHLLEAVRIDPDHTRAWGYLGLVQARLGRYDEAREAFLRSGHATMAERMDRMLGKVAAGASDVVTRPPAEHDSAAPSGRLTSGLEQLDPLEPFAPTPVDLPPLEAGAAAGSRPRPIAPAFLAQDVPALHEWLLRSELSFPSPGAVALDPGGDLLVQLADPGDGPEAEGTLAVRPSIVLLARGTARGSTVRRESHVAHLDGPLGGRQDPLVALRGPGQLVLRSGAGGTRLVPLRLVVESLFVRESVLVAFTPSMRHPSAELEVPGLDERLLVTHLFGPGLVVVLASRPLRSVALLAGVGLQVAPQAVVGWSGRVFPASAAGEGTAALVTLTGEGSVVLQ